MQMVGWLAVFVPLLLVFSPFNLGTEKVTVCGEPDPSGTMTCYTATVKQYVPFLMMHSV
jgi:hypothetical protein